MINIAVVKVSDEFESSPADSGIQVPGHAEIDIVFVVFNP
jgi:hypothetical protein